MSPSRRAVERIAATSEPAPGSVSPKHASFSPFACGVSQRCFCSSVAVLEQRERVEADVHRDQRPERRLAALDLLARERLGDEVEPGAAVLLRDHDAEDPELGHALDQLHVELVVDVVLDGDGQHALVHEGADGLLDQALLVGELEVHGGNTSDRERLCDVVERPRLRIPRGCTMPRIAELGHALDQIHIELVVDVVLDRDGEDPFVHEIADGLSGSGAVRR